MTTRVATTKAGTTKAGTTKAAPSKAAPSKAKPAPTPVPKPAPAVNKTRLAMQATLGVAAALTVLEHLEGDLLREDAETVMSNLRAALARLEARFGGEVLGHA